MKKLTKSLSLSKKSIQILDDRSLVDLRGGAASDKTCKEDSCSPSCDYRSCNQEAAAIGF